MIRWIVLGKYVMLFGVFPSPPALAEHLNMSEYVRKMTWPRSCPAFYLNVSMPSKWVQTKRTKKTIYSFCSLLHFSYFINPRNASLEENLLVLCVIVYASFFFSFYACYFDYMLLFWISTSIIILKIYILSHYVREIKSTIYLSRYKIFVLFSNTFATAPDVAVPCKIWENTFSLQWLFMFSKKLDWNVIIQINKCLKSLCGWDRSSFFFKSFITFY